VVSCSERGVRFRTGVVSGVVKKEVMNGDPSGNVIELFELSAPGPTFSIHDGSKPERDSARISLPAAEGRGVLRPRSLNEEREQESHRCG
jgi:hypothetical protein